MNRVIPCLRAVFVSIEFLVCMLGIGAFILYPTQLAWLGARLASQMEQVRYLGIIPVGLLAYDASVVKSVLVPEADKKRWFQRWEFYWEFKVGCYVGLAYAVLFVLAGLSSILLDWKAAPVLSTTLLFTSIIGAFTVSATLYHANLKIEELFLRHSDSNP